MADEKISELSALTTPDDADVLPIVDHSGPETKKITWANIVVAINALIDARPVGFLSQCRAYLSGSDQSVSADGNYHQVLLNAETYDTDSEFDPTTNHRFTANDAGYYLVVLQVTWNNPNQGSMYRVQIRVNGSSVSEDFNAPAASGGYLALTLSDIIHLSASDQIEIWVRNLSSGSTSVFAGSTFTFLAIHRIS